MTTAPISQCGSCQRLRGPLSAGAPEGLDGPWCEAFPSGIPGAVYDNELDHRQPVEGDHGLRWLARPGASYPVVYTHGVLTAAGSAPPSATSGAMIALVPTAEWAARAALPDGEGLAADDLHITLAFLGDDASLIDDAARAAIRDVVARAASLAPFEARAFAISLFNPTGDEPCVTLGLGGDELELTRLGVVDALAAAGVELPSQHRPWAPHVTLAYTDDHYLAADLVDRCGPVPIDRLRVSFAGEAVDYPLGAPMTSPCPPGQHQMPDGSCMPDDQMTPVMDLGAMADGTPWHHVIAVEGDWSGDGRMFAPGSLEWDDALLPIPAKWQEAEAGGHDGAVVVARVDGIRRVGPLIYGWGVMDSRGEHGAEAERLMAGGFLRGASIKVDDVSPLDAQALCPMVAPGVAGASGCEYVIHRGRIRSVTFVAEPAFPEALGGLGAPPPEIMTAAAVASHSTPISESTTWDAAANEARLPSPMPEVTGRAAFAWVVEALVVGGEMPKRAGKFIHHEVGADGVPGSANLTACSAGIAALNGARGGTDIDDQMAVWEHLARHLRDGDREPPPLTASLVAASHTITIPHVPPASWFDEPTEMPPFGALRVTDEGRVFGLLAPAGVTHRAFRASGQRVSAPRGVDYREFMNKPALVSLPDGSVGEVAAGAITMGCGHVDPADPRRVDPRYALGHYDNSHFDNSCSLVARVRVGESAAGTWVAGALLASATAEQVERMMACALSGDWQGGQLKGALLVPMEGFPVAASARAVDGAIVASTTPVRADWAARERLEELARRAGRDRASRMEALRARRDGGGR